MTALFWVLTPGRTAIREPSSLEPVRLWVLRPRTPELESKVRAVRPLALRTQEDFLARAHSRLCSRTHGRTKSHQRSTLTQPQASHAALLLEFMMYTIVDSELRAQLNLGVNGVYLPLPLLHGSLRGRSV